MTADPDAAYRFAKGLPVIARFSRSRVQIDTPLDFLLVTNHAEFMGFIPELTATARGSSPTRARRT